MNKRDVLKVASISAWMPPVMFSVALPAHAITSSGTLISVKLGVVPNFTITISDDKPNFSYTYRIDDGPPTDGASPFGSNSVVIHEVLTEFFVGSIYEIHVSVTDSDGNFTVKTISLTVEG